MTLTPADAPTRYDCLLCDDRFLTFEEICAHLEERKQHRPQDVLTCMLPMNVGGSIVEDLDVDMTVPKAVANGVCPVCDTECESFHSLQRHANGAHETHEVYAELRALYPETYDHSPESYDAHGYPEPAGTLMRLLPGDAVRLEVDGWEQSISSGRYQRDTVTDDSTWAAVGLVDEIDDPRDDPMALEWDRRQVNVHARTTHDDEGESRLLTLTPRPDGEIRLNMGPLIGHGTARQHGRGGPGLVRSTVTAIDRTPWYERRYGGTGTPDDCDSDSSTDEQTEADHRNS